MVNQYSMRPYEWVKARSAHLIEMKASGQLLVSGSSTRHHLDTTRLCRTQSWSELGSQSENFCPWRQSNKIRRSVRPEPSQCTERYLWSRHSWQRGYGVLEVYFFRVLMQIPAVTQSAILLFYFSYLYFNSLPCFDWQDSPVFCS
jgi:hypothetical protein